MPQRISEYESYSILWEHGPQGWSEEEDGAWFLLRWAAETLPLPPPIPSNPIPCRSLKVSRRESCFSETC